MIQAIRLWQVDNDILNEIPKTKLDFEERLEHWLSSDISIISSKLLVIGRQVETGFGGYIDLLCIEENGDLVIIELKRDKTPREITAQVLDYASWVNSLTAEQILDIANDYLDGINLEEAYETKFHNDLPDSINQEHKMLIIGSEIDSSSRRIINYLSEKHGVAINAVTFNYFRDNDHEYLARTFLIEPSKAEIDQKPRKRRRALTEEQLQEVAQQNGVGELYTQLVIKLNPLFDYKRTTRTTLGFKGVFEGKRITIFSLVPGESTTEEGVKFRIYTRRFSKYFEIKEEEATLMLPNNKREWKYYESAPPEYWGYEGFFNNLEEADKFLIELRKYRKLS